MRRPGPARGQCRARDASRPSCSPDRPLRVATNSQVEASAGFTHTAGCSFMPPPPCGTASLCSSPPTCAGVPLPLRLSRSIRRSCASLPTCRPRCATALPAGAGRITSEVEPRSVSCPQALVIGRRVAVEWQAAAATAAVGGQREHAVAPVEAAAARVEVAVAGGDVDAFGALRRRSRRRGPRCRSARRCSRSPRNRDARCGRCTSR